MPGISVFAMPDPAAFPIGRPRWRIASLTAGQAPRADVLPDILARLPPRIDVEEYGALDDLDDTEIAALAPTAGESALVTRLADGREVPVSKSRIAERLQALCQRLGQRRFDLVVILSTGIFRDFDSPWPMVNAQRAMDTAIGAIASSGHRVGVIYPLASQLDQPAPWASAGCSVMTAHAGTLDFAALQQAAGRLAGCDFVVLNSVGYGEAACAAVTKAAGKPAILARRVVAGAIRLLLGAGGEGVEPLPDEQARVNHIQARIEQLTARERQVMSLVAEGLTNKAIGRQLGISPRTVENHRARVMEKMGAQSSGALIRMVLTAQHPDL